MEVYIIKLTHKVTGSVSFHTPKGLTDKISSAKIYPNKRSVSLAISCHYKSSISKFSYYSVDVLTFKLVRVED